jgi:transcription initiation factor TFIIA large subunit
MSNQAVGNVYQTIIEEVINSSRVDFDESGVEESVLEELRQGWQQKLSQLDVARFPWDPKPDPPAAQPAPSQPASQSQISPQNPQLAAGTPSVQNGVKQEPGLGDDPSVLIKQEPGGPQQVAYNSSDSKSNNNVAANRAAQLVQQQYGNRAAGSINAIQDRIGQQAPNQSVPQQQQQPQPPHGANAQGSLQNAQTDGSADMDDTDFEGVLLRRAPGGDLRELGRVDIDRLLHDHITANAKSMEGGGLMVPLKEATKHKAGSSSKRGKAPIANHDGGDDDDDIDDEDAINSDLDDSEEDQYDDEVDDEGLGHIMLCMYDKVQRVKNKWKCTLKDGVLTVNGKEYVFHKATGEYEW